MTAADLLVALRVLVVLLLLPSSALAQVRGQRVADVASWATAISTVAIDGAQSCVQATPMAIVMISRPMSSHCRTATCCTSARHMRRHYGLAMKRQPLLTPRKDSHERTTRGSLLCAARVRAGR